MIRALCTLGAVCAFAVALGAQETSDQSKPAQKSETKGMVLSGCLQAGATEGTFTLTNATSTPRASTEKPSDPATQETTEPTPAPATPEAVGTTGEAGKAKTYELTAKTGVNLSAHVGHKVEVTTEAAAAKGDETRTTAETKAATPRLTVTAIKHISPTCP